VTAAAPIECPTRATLEGSTSGSPHRWVIATSRSCCSAAPDASVLAEPFPMADSVCALLKQAVMAQIRDRLAAAGVAADEEVDQHLANVAASHLDLTTSPMISTWGRKPGR
jgi:hypothetical protein